MSWRSLPREPRGNTGQRWKKWAADIAYALPVFEDLELALFFWAGDEEFSPQIRYLWDENALAYIRYETMYYVLDWLRTRLDLK